MTDKPYPNDLLDYAPNRNARRSALKTVAKRLSGALYGFSVSMAQSEEDILNGVKGIGPRRFPGPKGEAA